MRELSVRPVILMRGEVGSGLLAAVRTVAWLLVLAALVVACRPEAGAVPRRTDSGPVAWIWSGAVTATSAQVNAHLNQPSEEVRLAVSSDPGLADAIYSPSAAAGEESDNTVALTVDSLKPGSEYYYALEIDGRLDTTRQGRFRTFPEGPSSFRFTFSNGADTGSNMPVFDAIAAEDPLFVLNTGDFFYGDIDDNDIERFRDAFFASLTAPRRQAMFGAVPVAYVWDDHDFGPNNTDKTNPSREAARLAYQEIVPHYPLADDPADHPDCPYSEAEACRTINQSFAVGRAYFILTDLRSERDPRFSWRDDDKSMMGSVQRAWLEDQLEFAADNYELVFLISSVPWIERESIFAGGWGAFAAERERLADAIRDSGIENLIILAGDAHMIALDDGSHSDYASGGGAGVPVMHGGSLNRKGSRKGGPYSHGTFPNPSAQDGQYALVEVTDEGGDEICVRYRGKRLPSGASEPTTLIDWEVCK